MLYLALMIGGGLVGALAVIGASRETRGLTIAGFGAAALAFTLFCSVSFVPTGNVQLLRQFGVIQSGTLTEGMKFHAPWQATENVNVQRQQIDVDSSGADAAVVSLTADQVDLEVDLVFPYRLNPQSLGSLYSKVGGEDRIKQVLQNAGQSALRDTLATLKWEEAAITQRNKFEALLETTMQEVVSNDLRNAGLSEADAKSAVVLFPPIIKQAAPPARLTRELEEKQAALVELGRQKTLTEIAGEVANRRGQEGEGIAALLSKLPSSGKFTAAEIAQIIQANAAETRAQALLKAVESGKLGAITFSEVPAATNPQVK